VLGEIVARQMLRAPELELFRDFWCPPAAYLFRRSIVDAVGSWNEHLPIIQDARFALDCALQGGKFVYTPGIVAWYRTHSEASLSRRDPIAFIEDVLRNAMDIEQWWHQNGGLTTERKQAVIACYGYVARASYEKDPTTFDTAYKALTRLTTRYIPSDPGHLAVTSRVLGYRRAEAVALAWRRTKNILGLARS